LSSESPNPGKHPDFIGEGTPEKKFKKLLRLKSLLIFCSSFAAEATEDWKTKTKLTVGADEIISALSKLESEMPSRKVVDRHSAFCPLGGKAKRVGAWQIFEWKHSAAL
jgi:hypothetical protein